MEAVIFILKHATFLRTSNLSVTRALDHADLDYQQAKFDLKILQYLKAISQEHSVVLFADFIMATDISLSIPASVKRVFHHVCTEFAHPDGHPEVLVPAQSSSQTHVPRQRN